MSALSLPVNMTEDEVHKDVISPGVMYEGLSCPHSEGEVAPVGVTAGMHVLSSAQAPKIESTNTKTICAFGWRAQFSLLFKAD